MSQGLKSAKEACSTGKFQVEERSECKLVATSERRTIDNERLEIQAQSNSC